MARVTDGDLVEQHFAEGAGFRVVLLDHDHAQRNECTLAIINYVAY